MTVHQLLRSLPSYEIAEWHAFYMIEAEERRRAELDAKVTAGVKNSRRRRR